MEIKREFFDCIVLGAGVAGLTAALHASNNGLKVLILEKNQLASEKPGEFLHPGIEPLLKQLELWENFNAKGFKTANKVNTKTDNGFRINYFNEDKSWHSYHIDRNEFDQIYIDSLLKKDVAIKARESISEINVAVGNSYEIESNERIYVSKFLVDATGVNSLLSHKLDLHRIEYTYPFACYYGSLKAEIPIETPFFNADKYGWYWVNRTNNNVVWCRVFDAKKAKFNRKKHLPDYLQKSKIKGSSGTWRRVDKSSNGKYYIVGDAVQSFDPIQGKGMLKAIMTSIFAIDSIIHTKNGRLSAENAGNRYCEWIKNWFESDYNELIQLYKRNGLNPEWLKKVHNNMYSA